MFVILRFVLMPISPYWLSQLIFSATMFVYVFLTAILPPTCACPSVCVIIIGVRLQFVFRYRCFYLSVYFCACLPFWFLHLVIFLAFDLSILYCFRLSVCVCLLVCLTVCLSGTGVRLRTYVQFWVVWSFSVHFCQPSVSLFRPQVEENRKYRLHTMFDKAGDSIFINAREVVNKFHFKKGRYVVIPSTYEQNKAGQFLMRIFTEKSSKAM